MIAVTGATGHIGNVLVRQLLSIGKKVRAVVPAGENTAPLKGLDIEIVRADVRDRDSLLRAFAGVEYVYHLAGIISILPGKERLLDAVNVKGAQNVAAACLESGVKRLVHTSSIHAIKEPPHGKIITEEQPFDPGTVPGGYAKSKALGTLLILQEIDKGLDAVVVCPTGVIGPFDHNVSEMGQLVRSYLGKKIKVSIDGAYDFVDVRDVARGMVLACEKGKCGESYILSGERITIPELMSLLEKASGIKSPRYKVPAWLARIAGIMSTPYYLLSKAKPLFTAYSVDVLKSNSLVSSAKAKRELGYSARPLAQSITDTISWLRLAQFFV